MGNLKIKGSARKEFVADAMKITVTVSTKGETSALAVAKGKKETEKVLQLFVDMGVELSHIVMLDDSVASPGRYSDDSNYKFEKKISVAIETSLAFLEAFSAELVNREIDAVYTEYFYLSDVESAQREVLQMALMNSKKSAEDIALALGKKVVGIELAKCDDYESDDDDEPDPPAARKMSVAGYQDSPLASQLSADRVAVERNIDVSWIIE